MMTRGSALTLETAEAILAETYEREQRQLEGGGVLPASRRRPSNRRGGWLAVSGSIAIGLFIACFVLLFMFITFTMVFHVNFGVAL